MIAKATVPPRLERRTATNDRVIQIDESTIRRQGPGPVLGVCWRQWRTERKLAKRGIRFRTTEPDEAEAAYAAMSEGEFEAVNGRQDWANWRTIARSMSGLVPDRPITILDLGCGTGGSTRVLAWYAPLGSRITGYELARPLVQIARSRTYQHCSGRRVRVEFCCQGVAETFRDCFDHPLSNGSVDLVNASGIVGHHLDENSLTILAKELQRVLVPGGLAMLDVSPTLTRRRLTEILQPFGFEAERYRRSSVFDRTGQATFRRDRARHSVHDRGAGNLGGLHSLAGGPLTSVSARPARG